MVDRATRRDATHFAHMVRLRTALNEPSFSPGFDMAGFQSSYVKQLT